MISTGLLNRFPSSAISCQKCQVIKVITIQSSRMIRLCPTRWSGTLAGTSSEGFHGSTIHSISTSGVSLQPMVLFVLVPCIWLVVRCQEEPEMGAVIRLTEAADIWNNDVYDNIILFPMKAPSEDVSIMNIVRILKSPEKFSVLRMPQHLENKIPSLTSFLVMQESRGWLPEVVHVSKFSDKFAEMILEKAIYESRSSDQRNWIFIPIGTDLLTIENHENGRAHIDFLRDAGIKDLLELKEYGEWSVDLMVNLAKNTDVISAALNHYNGNVEHCAMDMLKIEHFMNIWIPTKPVKSWPLAFTPANQCDEARTEIVPVAKGGEQKLQVLLKSNSTKNDWYTRWNMQPNEVYVWDSRTVAHAVVKIGDGTGERSAIVSRLLILTPKNGSFPPMSSSPKYNTLCYTERFFNQVKSAYLWDDRRVGFFLKIKGYRRLCPSFSSTLS